MSCSLPILKFGQNKPQMAKKTTKKTKQKKTLDIRLSFCATLLFINTCSTAPFGFFSQFCFSLCIGGSKPLFHGPRALAVHQCFFVKYLGFSVCMHTHTQTHTHTHCKECANSSMVMRRCTSIIRSAVITVCLCAE